MICANSFGVAGVLRRTVTLNNNNKQALQTLLAYNEEDVVNLRVLRRKLRVK
ncbi:MAG TPA: hypothetical protein DIU00_18715 [Phycisphaerales bacterium]|nr:hypothetical protein [Phycisphaerales bacterium]